MQSSSEPSYSGLCRDLSLSWMDTTAWRQLRLRNDDIIIGTFPRSGTTWMQQIVSQLLAPRTYDLDIWRRSLWMEQKAPNEKKLKAADQLTGRRFFKSHAPFDVLPYAASVRYINVARDGRDVAWSQYAIFHVAPQVAQGVSTAKLDPRSFFLEWLEMSGGELNFFSHIRSWWDARQLSNVKLIHYLDLKKNLFDRIPDIAAFLDLDASQLPLHEIAERSSFNYMKLNARKILAGQEVRLPGASRHMIFKGENERWRSHLTPNDCKRYEQIAERELGIECAQWLATGVL